VELAVDIRASEGEIRERRASRRPVSATSTANKGERAYAGQHNGQGD
jgi:hypothetical protein